MTTTPGSSCRNCTYLCTRDTGYSNYTVLGKDMHCLLRANPAMPEEVPDEFNRHPETGDFENEDGVLRNHPEFDRWTPTANARCASYTTDLPTGAPNTSDRTWHVDCDGDEVLTHEQAVRMMTHEANVIPMLIHMYFKEKMT